MGQTVTNLQRITSFNELTNVIPKLLASAEPQDDRVQKWANKHHKKLKYHDVNIWANCMVKLAYLQVAGKVRSMLTSVKQSLGQT